MSLWIGVVTSGEIPVVAGDDCVLLSLLHVLSVPLAYARPTGIGQDHTSNVFQRLVLGWLLGERGEGGDAVIVVRGEGGGGGGDAVMVVGKRGREGGREGDAVIVVRGEGEGGGGGGEGEDAVMVVGKRGREGGREMQWRREGRRWVGCTP